MHEESLVFARGVDDGWLLSVATNNFGSLHLEDGDYERAAELFEESLAIGEGARRSRPACTGAHEPRLRRA